MVDIPEVKNLNTIIEPYLNGSKLISFRTRYLTKPGDNYGSTMLGITANIQTLNGGIEELELVAKLPPTNPDFWEIFKPERTFITEAKFYTELAPALRKLQEEVGISEDEIIDVFPKCYGARFNLNGNDDTVDKNATLVLENLYTSGYKCGDRMKGFDYEHALVIIRDLAYFHALSIALRKLKPEIFNSKIRPYIKKFDMGANIKEELNNQLKEANMTALKKANISEEDYKYIVYLFDLNEELSRECKECPDGPYSTAVHFDFWVNNMLILYDSNGKPERTKIIDFQISQYDSLVYDLVFFLFTSVQSEVLREKCDELVHHYYENFISCLSKLQCPTNKYSFEGFKKEIRQLAYLEIPHTIMMLRVLFQKRDTIPDDFKDFEISKISDETGVGEDYYQKILDIVELSKKFKWFKCTNE